MSAILKQLETYKAAAEVSAEFSDLVSVEALADMTRKSVVQVKAVCKSLGMEPVRRFGKSYLYSKREFLELTKTDPSAKLHAAPKLNK
jgi:hypothetical protein